MQGLTPREKAILDYDENFVKYWDKAFSELKAAGANENKVWLVGASSYLFSIGGVKFAVDLQIRRAKDLEAVADRICDDVSALSFVIITHQHDDHFCAPLIRLINHMPLTWYIPAQMPSRLAEKSGLDFEKCLFLNPNDSFEVGGLCVSAFASPHTRKGSATIMPELGYYFKSRDGSFIIPADVRDYDFCDFPQFSDIDLCFSHLWAGDNAIDMEEYLPMLEKFVDFSLRFSAKRYFICHLYEIGRKEKFLWHDAHAALAIERFIKKRPELKVEIPRLGTACELFLTIEKTT